jgi:hypothetical protein
MLPVWQGDFQTDLASVIGTGRVSGLCMWLRSATGRYGVRELGVQIDLSDFYVLDLYCIDPTKLTLNLRGKLMHNQKASPVFSPSERLKHWTIWFSQS